MKLLQTRSNEIKGGQMLDTYNQQIQEEVSCTIRTNINTANHHYITTMIEMKTDKTICLNSKVDGKQPSLEHCIYDSEGLSTAITTGFLPSVATYRIRKLTPRECFRLMGVDDKDIDKIQAAGISNSQQYKLAGNSIVVDVLYHIFRKAFCETQNENQQQTLF